MKKHQCSFEVNFLPEKVRSNFSFFSGLKPQISVTKTEVAASMHSMIYSNLPHLLSPVHKPCFS